MNGIKKVFGSKAASAVVAVILIAGLLMCAFFVSRHVCHDCIGEDCEICQCIMLCSENLTSLADITTACSSIAAFALILITLCATFDASAFADDTLISCKVRLNN